MPSDGLEFQITDVNDPYGCNTNPTTGLTGSTAGTVSIYRRPLPATNLGFLSTIMWDGREPSLFSQAVDATLGPCAGSSDADCLAATADRDFRGLHPSHHSEPCASTPPVAAFSRRRFSTTPSISLCDGANGGPISLSKQLAKFFVGINDPLGQNPTGAPFNADISTSTAIGAVCRVAIRE